MDKIDDTVDYRPEKVSGTSETSTPNDYQDKLKTRLKRDPDFLESLEERALVHVVLARIPIPRF